jgi:hypothetical protein
MNYCPKNFHCIFQPRKLQIVYFLLFSIHLFPSIFSILQIITTGFLDWVRSVDVYSWCLAHRSRSGDRLRAVSSSFPVSSTIFGSESKIRSQHLSSPLFQISIHYLPRVRYYVCLSIYLHPSVGPLPLFQFLELFTQSGDEPFARPLPAHRTA